MPSPQCIRHVIGWFGVGGFVGGLFDGFVGGLFDGFVGVGGLFGDADGESGVLL